MKNSEFHVRLGQTEIVELQDAGHLPHHQAERVQVRDLVAAQTIDLDHARYGGLFLGRRGDRAASGYDDAAFGRRRRIEQALADRAVSDLGRTVTDRAEVFSPAFGYGVWIFEIALVHRLDRGRIAAEERRRLVLFFQ